jgi:hypothetical protein
MQYIVVSKKSLLYVLPSTISYLEKAVSLFVTCRRLLIDRTLHYLVNTYFHFSLKVMNGFVLIKILSSPFEIFSVFLNKLQTF